jgi:hypothetical protein
MPTNGVVVGSEGSSMFHRSVPVASQGPCSTWLPFLYMIASIEEKVAVYPALHSFPVLRRLMSLRAGNKSVLVASGSKWGRCKWGRCKCAVCVDCMVVWSGSLTASAVGVVVGCLL